jgi:hypothetical protein
MFAASKSGQSVALVDPYFPYVPLLLDTTGTDGQQNNTFLDSSTNNFSITRGGAATQGSVTPYWPNGYWSNYFSGTPDYLTTSNTAPLQFGTTDFTIEAWVNISDLSNNRFITIQEKNAVQSNSDLGVLLAVLSTGAVYFGWCSGATQSNITSSTALIKTGAWNHIAAVRIGSAFALYINGVSRGTATSSVSINSALFTNVGRYSTEGATTSMIGYISSLRIVKGVGVYTGAFTPPTTPLSSTQSSGTNISAITGTQTSFLTCQSNRFINNSLNTFAITVTGSPQAQAFQPFSPTTSYTTTLYGGSSYFNGTADYLANNTNNTALALGSGNFTLEFWMNAPTTASGLIIYDNRLNTASATGGFQIYHQSGTIYVYGGTITDVLLCSASIIYNTWVHVAVVRSGSGTGNVKLYINGALASTYGSADTNNYALGYLNIANYRVGGVPSGFYNGYLSNFRIVKGTAVYTGAFTPPTLAPIKTAGATSAASYTSTTNVDITFSAANTSLLLNFTNAGVYDAAVQNNAVTVGDAQASTTQKQWSPTSLKLDGAGDWLTLADGTQLQLGTSDFTIDGWLYLTANGAIYGILSKGTATTGWSLNVTALNKLQFSYTASNLTGATSLAATTWYYFAVVRSGSATGNLKIYLNGAVDATSGGAVTDNFNQTNILYVGASRTGLTPLTGYLQDVRITRGFARTIATPPAAFPTR